ncbi:MAG: hypothetical protein R6U84_08025 [Candidatus Cloacimonadales bacterium]
MKSIKLLLGIFLLVLIFSACDDRSLEIEEYSIENVLVEKDTITITPGGTQEASMITAFIVDEDGWPAENVDVRFQTDLGKVNAFNSADAPGPIADLLSNAEGKAEVLLYEQDEAGTANVDVIVHKDIKTVQVEIVEPE